jgi:hypothetical protein
VRLEYVYRLWGYPYARNAGLMLFTYTPVDRCIERRAAQSRGEPASKTAVTIL